MARTLSIEQKPFKLEEPLHIVGADGGPVYEAVWRRGLFAPTCIISKTGMELARVKKQPFARTSTWCVVAGGLTCQLHRKVLAFACEVLVFGGRFDDSELNGSMLDYSFQLTRGDVVLARAVPKELTPSDRRAVEVLEDSDDAELFTAILIANLLAQRSEEDRRANRRN